MKPMNPKLKLSEAILKGCQGTVKIKGLFVVPKECLAKDLPKNGCCVLGAAAVGVLGSLSKARKQSDIGNLLYGHFPFLGTFSNETNLRREIVDRNNNTDETRESIAAWLAKKGL
jgi:hypothetical protein